MAKQKSIEEKYKSMSEIEHVLNRSGMWIGSVRSEEADMFLYDRDDKLMKMETINYVPGMLKLVDEVISNSCDEYRRKDNLGLNKLRVSINKKDKSITIYDNGGIPVVKHKEAKCYIPEFIFGQLRTSSNYDDTEDRSVIGTNGVGSSLTNIFSKSFKVETSDGKKLCTVEWEDNMSYKSDPEIENSKKNEHHTEIVFNLDWDRFETNTEDWFEDFCKILEKRCIDAAIANPGLEVTFSEMNGKDSIYKSVYKFKNFKEYIELYKYYIDIEDSISFEDDYKRVYVYPDGNINVGFVNGAECSKGTHIKELHGFINNKVSEFLKKKNKIDVTPRQIDGKYSMFCELTVSNPAYSSQTKQELTTPVNKFYKDETIKFEVPENFLNKIVKSEIVELVLDWYRKKAEAEDAAKIRKLNKEAKKLLRSDKFINCNSKKREEKQLWIYEGDSAASGHRNCRNSMTQAGYLMRGVPKNVIEETPTGIMKNQVFNDIVNIIGLQWGEYNKSENLKFGKVIICSDADPDGDKIACLLMVFFNHFPELFEQGLVYRCSSPIIIAKDKKGKSQAFYSFDDWRKVENKPWASVKHIKGIGTQNIAETKEMMQNPHLIQITKDNMADMMLKKWFGKGIAHERKSMLKEEAEA